MAKNDALVVLHSALDYRKIIDVPGYEKISLDPLTRFIGTMNYDYAGTRELNEALVSRFMVVDIPPIGTDILMKILHDDFPDAKDKAIEQFAGAFPGSAGKSGAFRDLDKVGGSAGSSRRSGRSGGLSPQAAVKIGVSGKTFDQYEREIVEDIDPGSEYRKTGRGKRYLSKIVSVSHRLNIWCSARASLSSTAS